MSDLDVLAARASVAGIARGHCFTAAAYSPLLQAYPREFRERYAPSRNRDLRRLRISRRGLARQLDAGFHADRDARDRGEVLQRITIERDEVGARPSARPKRPRCRKTVAAPSMDNARSSSERSIRPAFSMSRASSIECSPELIAADRNPHTVLLQQLDVVPVNAEECVAPGGPFRVGFNEPKRLPDRGNHGNPLPAGFTRRRFRNLVEIEAVDDATLVGPEAGPCAP